MTKAKVGVLVVVLLVALTWSASAGQSIWPLIQPDDPEETQEDGAARMGTIRAAIKTASARAVCYKQPDPCIATWPGDRATLEWSLLGLARFESALLLRVHLDQCQPGECDGGKAKSLWQLHVSHWLPLEAWQHVGGVDQESTDAAAWAAARALAYGFRRCRSLRGAFTLYATGSRCENWIGPDGKDLGEKRAAWVFSRAKKYRF